MRTDMLSVQKLTPYIHRLKVPFYNIYTSIFLVRADDGIVVFDTAACSEDIDTYLLPALKQLDIRTGEVKYAVISHNHGDHAGGLSRFTECFPLARICAGSSACEARIKGTKVRCLSDGETLCGPLKAVAIPGHTADCVGILDTRTNSLLSGDGLQACGIYSTEKWGTNITMPTEHLAALEKLRGLELQSLYTAHDYHPCGNEALGRQAIGKYLDRCALALYDIRDFLASQPKRDAEAAAEAYNAVSGLPTVGHLVIGGMMAAMEKGAI